MKVRFTEVGRDKRTWEEDFPVDEDGLIDDLDMENSVRKHARLMSDVIDFTNDSLILVGMVRPVGRWEILV